MPSNTDSPYVEVARQRLSALMAEAAADRSLQRRSGLNERIELARELLRVAAQQEVSAKDIEPVNTVRSLC
jgi:hypothetical protein